MAGGEFEPDSSSSIASNDVCVGEVREWESVCVCCLAMITHTHGLADWLTDEVAFPFVLSAWCFSDLDFPQCLLLLLLLLLQKYKGKENEWDRQTDRPTSQTNDLTIVEKRGKLGEAAEEMFVCAHTHTHTHDHTTWLLLLHSSADFRFNNRVYKILILQKKEREKGFVK